MTRTLELTLFALVALGLQACATSFTGSAHVDGGRKGCENKCGAEGLTMSGLVYLGEYSSACVCSVPDPSPAAAALSRHEAEQLAAGAAEVAGVMLQMAKETQEPPSLISFPLQ